MVIEGNDKADKLAKESLNQTNIFYDGLHCDELKPIFNAKALSDMVNYIKDYDFRAGLKGSWKYIDNNDEFSFNCYWFDRYDL